MKIKKTPLQARGRAYIMGNIKFREENQLWGGQKPYEMEFRFAVIVSVKSILILYKSLLNKSKSYKINAFRYWFLQILPKSNKSAEIIDYLRVSVYNFYRLSANDAE